MCKIYQSNEIEDALHFIFICDIDSENVSTFEKLQLQKLHDVSSLSDQDNLLQLKNKDIPVYVEKIDQNKT